MAENENIASEDSGTEPVGQSEIFGEGVRLDVSMRDLFGGDLSMVRTERKPVETASEEKSRSARFFNATHAVLLLNVLLIGGLLMYFVKFCPLTAEAVGVEESAVTGAQAAAAPSTAPQPVNTPLAETPMITLTRNAADALQDAISLQSARRLAEAGEFYEAAYIYEQLRLNITGSEVKDQVLRDWLSLQMGICLQKTQEQDLMGECFTRALQSRSMVVRAMANYTLAVMQINNRQFLESRSRAFQAIGLLKIFEKSMPERMEADCYFMAAEGLTRYLLQMSNQGSELPAAQWSDSIPFHELPVLNQEQLCSLLVTGVDQMEQAAIMPMVAYYPERHVGSQWSVTSMDAPLEQLLWQFASETKLNIAWDDEQSNARRKRATVFLPFSERLQVVEVVTGAVGLVWHYDGQGGTIYDPARYKRFADIQQVLTQEAISSWQRFLLHYRADSRAANAHYCLGRLFDLMGEHATSLGEYKLVSTQYYSDTLAPQAILDASRVKTELLDYDGAREDLNELLIRYPNCKVADTAMLYLAEATLKGNYYKEAFDLFDQVWRLNVSDADRCAALFGMGRCAYELKDYKRAIEQLSQALKRCANQDDLRIGPACFLLGRSYIETGDFAKATGALRMALGKALDDHEYVEIVSDLVDAECSQENYLQALTLLESIPEQRLSQEDTCRLMVKKARIYRDIDLPDTAISVLRRKIEFIAEAPLRAMLSVELARCYLSNSDLRIAKKEANDALYDLPIGQPRQEGCYLLAEVCRQMGDYQQAESFCVQAIQTQIQDPALKARVFGLLGRVYSEQKLYDKAALAYAGVLKTEAVQ